MATTDNNDLSVQIHTYVCVDGIVRTRCIDHIPTHGAYAPSRHRSQLSSTRTEERTRRCIECYYAQFVPSAENA